MKEEVLVFLGIFITLAVTSQCPSDLIEEYVGCVAIATGQESKDDNEKSRCYYLYKPMEDLQNQQSGVMRNEASQICSCHNKTLPHAMSNDARIVVSEALKKLSHPQGVWLIGQKKVTEKWVNSQMVPMETSDLINRMESHECAYVVKEGDVVKLKPEMCSASNYVICQTGNCVSSYANCLDIGTTSNLTWFGGRSSCREKNFDILSFESPDDLIKLGTHIQPGVKYWVGIRKAIWQWNETVEIEQFHWAPGEPSSKGESCLALTQEGRWEDVTCSLSRYALCWKDEAKDIKKPGALGAIIGGIVAAVVVAIVIIIALVAVLLRRKRQPISERDVDNFRRKTHIKKRNTEVQTEYGIRYSDISDNLNVEDVNSQGL